MFPNPTVVAVEETGGPTRLSIGSIPDGQTVVRSGSSLVGGGEPSCVTHLVSAPGLYACAENDTTVASGQASMALGSGTRAGMLPYVCSVAAGGTLVTIPGNVVGEFLNGETFRFKPTNPVVLPEVSGTIASQAVFGGVNTTFNIAAPIDGSTVSGVIVESGGSIGSRGFNARSEGAGTIALGADSWAGGYNCSAVGAYSRATGATCKAYGDEATAEGEATIAAGVDSSARGGSNVALGFCASTDGGAGASLGNAANGDASYAGGRGCRTGNIARTFTVAAGGTTITIAGNVTTEFTNGVRIPFVPLVPRDANTQYRTLTSVPAFAAGNTTFTIDARLDFGTTGGLCVDGFTSGLSARATGDTCVATGTDSDAGGLQCTTSGAASFARGFANVASGLRATCLGSNGLASGTASGTLGDQCTASGAQSFAGGLSSTATNSFAFAFGGFSHATGINSCAIGDTNAASGQDSCALNGGNTANSLCAFACGLSNTAGAAQAFASGNLCTASGINSFVLGGLSNVANNTDAAAGGNNSTSSGVSSFAFGNTVTATGNGAHAEGAGGLAAGDSSHVQGTQAKTFADSEHAEAAGFFVVVGDNQLRRTQLKGSTPGVGLGETTTLRVLVAANIVRASFSYLVTVRAIATRMGLGAAARQSVAFFKVFEVDVTSGNAVTISAVTDVVAPIVTGVGFVGATLIPTSGGANDLTLTFAIAAGLTVQSRITASVEYVEVLGT